MALQKIVAPMAGNWTLIGTQEASASASLTQTGITSTYDIYAIVLTEILPQTDNTHLHFRLGDSSGIDSGTDYAYNNRDISSAASAYADNPSAGDNIMLAALGVGNGTGEGVSGTYYLGKPSDGPTRSLFWGSGAFIDSAGATGDAGLIGSRLVSIVHDRVFVKFSSGNIISGRMSVFGISHS